MALDLIGSVGPGGQYLDNNHTAEHFNTEFWFPSLMDRSHWDQWKAEGEKRLRDRVREKLNPILDTHKVLLLPEQIRKEIDAILSEADTAARPDRCRQRAVESGFNRFYFRPVFK